MMVGLGIVFYTIYYAVMLSMRVAKILRLLKKKSKNLSKMGKIIKKIKEWLYKCNLDILLLLIIIMISVLLFLVIKNNLRISEENERLTINQEVLTTDVRVWRDKDSSFVAQIATLKLTKEEFDKLYEQQAKEIKDMNIKLKRLLSYSQAALSHNYTITDTIRDSVIIRENKIDTLTCVNYNDDYIKFNGCIDSGVFNGNIETFDTITSVVHIIPKKFLWFKYGVKRVDFTVKSRNPYSTIEDIKYIDINK